MQVEGIRRLSVVAYDVAMSKSNLAGKDESVPRINAVGRNVKAVIQWLLGRDVTESEMADALGVPSNTYIRHREAPDYPNFEQLNVLGEHFGLSPQMLQIAFGHLGPDHLVLLSDQEMAQYELQGGEVPARVAKMRSRFRLRDDTPPLH